MFPLTTQSGVDDGRFPFTCFISCGGISNCMLCRTPSAYLLRVLDLLQLEVIDIINGRITRSPVFPFQGRIKADCHYFIPLIFIYLKETMVPRLVYEIDEMRTAGRVISCFGGGTVVCKCQVHIDHAGSVTIGIDGKEDSVVSFPIFSIDVIGDAAVSIGCIVGVGGRAGSPFSCRCREGQTDASFT